MPVVTPRLALAVASGVVLQVAVAVAAVDLGAVVLMSSLALVALLATVDAVSALDPDSVALERSMPPVVTLGDTAEITWTVTNPSTRGVSVGVADELAPSLGAETRRFEMVVPPRRPTRVTVGIEPTRRGRFRPSEVTVRTIGPWGLAGRQSMRELPQELRVHPRFVSFKDAELRVQHAKVLDFGLRATRIRGAGTDFDHLREYTVDDESSRIDWAATARARRPVVRTYRTERNQTVVNLLDAGRVMAGRVDDVPRLEHAMDAVMTLTAVAAGLGDRCGLGVFDRSLHTVVAASAGRTQLGRVTEALHDVEPSLVESDYLGAFASALSSFTRRSLLVVHTDLVDQVVVETLLPAMPLIARSHLVVIAAVTDPQVVAWATGDAASGDAARRKAAAQASLADRERASARLRSLGATVVDGAPREVSVRLADAYLNLKAHGRL